MNKVIARVMVIAWVVTFAASVAGCGPSRHYDRVKTGELSGDLIVQWMKPDKFLFLPDESNPLTFRRFDDEVIVPPKMFTDGGSIPRPIRALKNYSPWGYAPAFIVHDYIFVMQDCQWPGYDQYTIEDAAMIMSEVMKTMMEDPSFDYGDKTAVYMMYHAVKSPLAQKAWDDHHCPDIPDPAADDWIPSMTFEVSFESRD